MMTSNKDLDWTVILVGSLMSWVRCNSEQVSAKTFAFGQFGLRRLQFRSPIITMCLPNNNASEYFGLKSSLKQVTGESGGLYETQTIGICVVLLVSAAIIDGNLMMRCARDLLKFLH